MAAAVLVPTDEAPEPPVLSLAEHHPRRRLTATEQAIRLHPRALAIRLPRLLSADVMTARLDLVLRRHPSHQARQDSVEALPVRTTARLRRATLPLLRRLVITRPPRLRPTRLRRRTIHPPVRSTAQLRPTFMAGSHLLRSPRARQATLPHLRHHTRRPVPCFGPEVHSSLPRAPSTPQLLVLMIQVLWDGFANACS